MIFNDKILWSKVNLLLNSKLPVRHKIGRVSIQFSTIHSIAMCCSFFGIILIQSVVSIDANRIKLSQLEKMVADLEVSHDILLQKINFKFENILRHV